MIYDLKLAIFIKTIDKKLDSDFKKILKISCFTFV